MTTSVRGWKKANVDLEAHTGETWRIGMLRRGNFAVYQVVSPLDNENWAYLIHVPSKFVTGIIIELFEDVALAAEAAAIAEKACDCSTLNLTEDQLETLRDAWAGAGWHVEDDQNEAGDMLWRRPYGPLIQEKQPAVKSWRDAFVECDLSQNGLWERSVSERWSERETAERFL